MGYRKGGHGIGSDGVSLGMSGWVDGWAGDWGLYLVFVYADIYCN